jgi:hypothetical protein
MKPIVIAAASLALALAACTKAETQKSKADFNAEADKTAHDIKAGADDLGAKAKEAAHSPEAKKLGSDIKAGAKDVGHVAKEAIKGAAAGAKQGADEVKHKDAEHDSDKK